MKKKTLLSLTLTTGVLLAACGAGGQSEASSDGDSNTINIGVTSSPAGQLFLDEVAPILEEEHGYTVEATEFGDHVALNNAMEDGFVDLNVGQTTLYAESFNVESGGNLQTITSLPTLPHGLFASDDSTLEDVQPGDTVAIADDAANMNRALDVLSDTGWIEFEEDVAATDLTLDDITENHAGIEITPVNLYTLPRSLADVDYAVIPGTLLADTDINPSTALATENLKPDYYLQLVVPEHNKDEPWVQAVADIYNSEEFAQRLDEINEDPNQPNWTVAEESE